MRKKLFTFLLALTASIGMMWAETVVVINKSEFTSSGVTKEGVTLALSNGSMTSSDVVAMNGSFEFSTSLGKFTGITIETDANIMEIYEGAFTSAGWPTGDNLGKSAVWTGESETVLISCMVAGMDNITITCTIEPAQASTPLGDGDKLSGAFSVSSTKVVYFSKGNLQYDSDNQIWQFAANQWDYIGNAAGNNAITSDGIADNNGIVDMFCWVGASSSLEGIKQYGIIKSWSGYGSVAGEALKSDWGNTMGGDWRTLSKDEWIYLLTERTNAANLRTLGTVNGKAGLILMPDGWTASGVSLTVTTANYTTNDINITNWATLEGQGCAFLPAAGCCMSGLFDGVGGDGSYWSSTSRASGSTHAHRLHFRATDVDPTDFVERFTGMSVRLVSETAPSGGSTPALQVTELEVPGSWYHDFTSLTASDFPGFVAASAAEAQAWSGAPKSGLSCLIYAFEDDEAKVCYFEDGTFSELGARGDRDDIYYRFDEGYQIYYTGTAPVYTLLSTITMQLENSQFVENHTNPNVASIGKSCNVTYAQYANYIAWKTDPWSSGEMLLVMPKAGYTITKVVFTRDNNPSNKVIVTSAPFTASVTNSDNVSKIEVYGEAETPAAPVVVASWTSNECNVVLTNDGKLTVSKNEGDGEMEDMNSYQSTKWRCFSNLVTSVEIQEGVTRIGDYAFYNMQNISSISLPNTLLYIGDGAFFDCPITGDVVIPEHVETIGSNAFAMIGQSASTVSIPASVTSIGQWAFQNKSTEDITSTNVITAINVDAANPNYCSVDGILYSKDMTTLIAYPAGKTATEYVIPSTVTEIKSRALYSCVYITTLTIPAGTSLVEYDGYAGMAFSGCYGLTDIYNNATTPQTISSVLSWMDKGQGSINLYIPSGTRAAYEAADGWKDLNIIDSSTPTPQPEGDGKLTGAFTINADGDQILFSKGNLQYQASTTTWQFATNQFDLIGADNANISDTYTGWIDLFGWGTGNCPTKKSTVDEDYPTFTDWGTNAISNGGNEANLWRTLTIQEWGYLIKTRTNADNLKGQATVADVHGFVLLPDSWTLPAGLSFTASPNDWTTNVYTAEQWAQMEAAGAVFLPATGYRNPDIVYVGEKGWYWSSDVLTANAAYDFEFTETTSRVFGSRHYFGQPVRLVTAAPAVAPQPTTEEVITNEDPENPSYHYSTFFHSTQNYKLTNDGTQAFIADLSGSDLVLTKIAEGTQVIPANTAVILRKSGSADPVVLTPTEENGVSVNPDDNSLEGVDAETAITSIDGLTTTNCYVLSGTNEYGVGFYRINSDNLKAHKAYVKYAGLQNNAPKRMRFVFNQEQTATSIDNTNAVVESQKILENGVLYIIRDGVRYNAQGQLIK